MDQLCVFIGIQPFDVVLVGLLMAVQQVEVLCGVDIKAAKPITDLLAGAL